MTRRNATQFTFQATLLATIPVEAATQAEAERKLRTVLETSDATLVFWTTLQSSCRSRLRGIET